MRFLKQWFPVILWAAVIVGASSDTFSSDHTRHWLEVLLRRQLPDAVNYTVRKCSHVLEYAILGALAFRADRRLTVAIGVALAVSTIDELRQGFTLTRTGSPWDVVIDVCGGSLGAATFRRWGGRRDGIEN
jgi:VanZ family protein